MHWSCGNTTGERGGWFALIERGANRGLWEEADVEDYEERKKVLHTLKAQLIKCRVIFPFTRT
ncbi:hypothetical protein H0I83_04955 [Bacillus thuringiensis serovar fukuokaensis]|nr:hypothetical protein BK710_13330 [Bacillus thuringiensis serovar sumiyoshiensis]OTW93988.1 hypothetical protein BK711_24490 [Bacillus thuringiensis serovar fukuokaensis]HDX9705462.1 hypothetical protein [Bacillus thuringiensis]